MSIKNNETFDYSELLGKMKKEKITQEELAKRLSINPSTLNQKINNRSEFTQKEMREILKILGEPLENVAIYFFSQNTLENAS